jgi:hypothetical protein
VKTETAVGDSQGKARQGKASSSPLDWSVSDMEASLTLISSAGQTGKKGLVSVSMLATCWCLHGSKDPLLCFEIGKTRRRLPKTKGKN